MRDIKNSAVALQGITKYFPRTIANDQISLAVYPGEVLALLGENGAGKSTLMKILYGIYQPDAGQIYVQGQEVKIKSPQDALALGIGMIHQHFSLVPVHTVVENVLLSCQGFDLKKMADKIITVGQKYGLEVDPWAIIEDLPVGMQQRVEIIKALCLDAKILIMDEPTAVLTPLEVHKLLDFVREFKSQGQAVVFISHKLDEVMEIADEVTVLRAGKVAGTLSKTQLNQADLIQLMVGHELKLVENVRELVSGAKPILTIENLQVKNDLGLSLLKNLNFTIAAGEICGIAGVSGNGQDDLAQALTGLRKVQAGKIILDNQDITNFSPHDRLGLGYVPPDHHKEGLVLDMSLEENLLLKSTAHYPYCQHGILNPQAIRQLADQAITDYAIRTPGPTVAVKGLSGGNQQKVVVAREVRVGTKLLIVFQPTRGLDLGAIDYVHRVLLRQAEQGVAILLISTELSEVLSLSDQIAIMFRGQLTPFFKRGTLSLAQIGAYMAGVDLPTAMAGIDLPTVEVA